MSVAYNPKNFKLHVSGQKEPISISVSTPNADNGSFEKMAKLTDKGNPKFKIIGVDLAGGEPHFIPQTYDPEAEKASKVENGKMEGWVSEAVDNSSAEFFDQSAKAKEYLAGLNDHQHFAGVTKAQIDAQLKKLKEEDDAEAKHQVALEFLEDKAMMEALVAQYSQDPLIDTKPLFSLSASAKKVSEDLKNLSKAIGGMNKYIPGKVVKTKENPLGGVVPYAEPLTNLLDIQDDPSKIVYAGDVLFDKFAGEIHDGIEDYVPNPYPVVPRVELCMVGNHAPEHVHPAFKWVHTDVQSVKDIQYQAYRCRCPYCNKDWAIPFESIHGSSFHFVYERLRGVGIDPESLDGPLREGIIKL